MAVELIQTNSVLGQFIRELRDIEIQKDKNRFKRNLERIGAVVGYELSKKLIYKKQVTITQLGKANTNIVSDNLVVATILRAGLPLQQGLASVFDHAELAFVGASRKSESSGSEVEIDLSYVACANLDGKVLIIADTMLATGHSLVEAYQALIKKNGTPNRTFIVSVIASTQGIKYVETKIPGVEIIAVAVDAKLNSKFYIVPGLGDAGDLLYGLKNDG